MKRKKINKFKYKKLKSLNKNLLKKKKYIIYKIK